jgi:hypothetical protein
MGARRRRRRVAYPEIEQAVRAIVERATPEQPIRRKALIAGVVARVGDLYPDWRPATWFRRVTEVTQRLQLVAPPLVNCRGGFFYARSEADLRAGYRYKRRLAFTILSDTARAMGCTLPEMARQLDLEFGEDAR